MKLKEWERIDDTFFEIDEKEKIAKIVLKYEKPEDILDRTCVSEIPLLRLETLGYFRNIFGKVSPKYKVDLTLRFDDFSDYTEEQLFDRLKKNMAIELKSRMSASRSRDKLAYGFIAAGVLSFLLMFLVRCVWNSETVWNELFFYLFDIITTVSLYQAVTILGLERKEKLAVVKNLHDSFSAIHFEIGERKPMPGLSQQ